MRRKRSIIAVVCIIAFFLSGCAHKDSDDVGDITHKSNTTTKVYISDEAEVVTDEDKKVTVVTEANKVIVKKEDSNPTTVTEMPKTVTENSTTETRNIIEIRVPEESDVGIGDETELATSTTTGVINEETTENTTTPMETTIIPETTTISETTSSNSTVSENYPNDETSYISNLPDSIMDVVSNYMSMYPNMRIGVGIYSLDGRGYEYNAYTPFNGACTIKASYACFVLKQCEARGIDIWSETITYEPKYNHGGSGVIQYGGYGVDYSIGYLISVLLGESDNDAYEMLLSEFPLNEFYQYNYSIGGQDDWSQWGRASVYQRKNEWLEIYNYVNSGSKYSNTLRQCLTGTKYAYLMYNTWNYHSYMHKSGWTDDSFDYPASADCAIIDDSYLVIVMTEDYSIGSGHIDAISAIGRAVESCVADLF